VLGISRVEVCPSVEGDISWKSASNTSVMTRDCVIYEICLLFLRMYGLLRSVFMLVL